MPIKRMHLRPFKLIKYVNDVFIRVLIINDDNHKFACKHFINGPKLFDLISFDLIEMLNFTEKGEK